MYKTPTHALYVQHYSSNSSRYGSSHSQLDPKLQSTFRYLATKEIRHTLKSNRHNIFHKRLQYSVNKIKEIMENNDLALVNADKSKTMAIIDKTN